jgi:hypothetical protein
MVQGQPRQIVFEIPITKTARKKWTGGVAQVIECLPFALSSNPGIAKKIKSYFY